MGPFSALESTDRSRRRGHRTNELQAALRRAIPEPPRGYGGGTGDVEGFTTEQHETICALRLQLLRQDPPAAPALFEWSATQLSRMLGADDVAVRTALMEEGSCGSPDVPV